jgi:hypothetical protein
MGIIFTWDNRKSIRFGLEVSIVIAEIIGNSLAGNQFVKFVVPNTIFSSQ